MRERFKYQEQLTEFELTKKKLDSEIKLRENAKNVITKSLLELDSTKATLMSAVDDCEQTKKMLREAMTERDILGT